MEFVIVTPEPVLKDIITITKWYDLQYAGLSKKFEEQLFEVLEKLKLNPYAFSESSLKCRKIRLKNFLI